MFKSSLILVTRNNWDILKSCLKSIYENTVGNYHLYVIDNGSSDDTLGLYGLNLPNTTIVRNNKNEWWVGGINQGISLSINTESEYIFFMNDDIEVPKNWLLHHIEILNMDKVGAVGALNSSKRDWQGYDNVRNRFKDLNLPPLSDIDRNDLEKMNNEIKDIKLKYLEVVGMLAFFLVGFRSSTIKKLGMLDDDFTELMCGDDDDYCRRLAKEKFRLILLLNTYIIHKGGSSIKKLNDFDERSEKASNLLKNRYPDYYKPK